MRFSVSLVRKALELGDKLSEQREKHKRNFSQYLATKG